MNFTIVTHRTRPPTACRYRSVPLRCAALILEPVLGFRGSRALTQEIICGAQAAYLFSDRGRDELVQRYALRGRQFGGCLLHRRGRFQWLAVLAHFLIIWTITLGVTTSISKSRAAGKKSRTLCVTMTDARPSTAASSTNSSAGSVNCGRHIK